MEAPAVSPITLVELFKAIKAGDVITVQKAIESDQDLDQYQIARFEGDDASARFEYTPLLIAIRALKGEYYEAEEFARRMMIFKLLLNANTNVNLISYRIERDRSGKEIKMPYKIALELARMIDTGMSLDYDSIGYKIENEVFLLLLQNDADPDNPRDNSLQKTLDIGDEPKIKMLLAYNAKSRLFSYLRIQHEKRQTSSVIVKYLVRYYVNTVDNNLTNINRLNDILNNYEFELPGNVELNKWVKENVKRIIKYFEASPTDIPEYTLETKTTYFMHAARRGYIGVMRWYLSTVINPTALINQVDVFGNNALHYAISYYELHEDPYTIIFLIEIGGNLFQKNSIKTPLDLLQDNNYFNDPELQKLILIQSEGLSHTSLASILPRDVTDEIQ